MDMASLLPAYVTSRTSLRGCDMHAFSGAGGGNFSKKPARLEGSRKLAPHFRSCLDSPPNVSIH